MYIYICTYIYTSAPSWLETVRTELTWNSAQTWKRALTWTWKEFANLKKYTNLKKCADIKKGPQTYGPKGGEKWSCRSQWSHWWRAMVPTHIQISIPIHWFIDRSIGHGRFWRSIRLHHRKNTVDIDGHSDYTYEKLWSIVDCRLIIEIICGRFYRRHLWRIQLKNDYKLWFWWQEIATPKIERKKEAGRKKLEGYLAMISVTFLTDNAWTHTLCRPAKTLSTVWTHSGSITIRSGKQSGTVSCDLSDQVGLSTPTTERKSNRGSLVR